VLAKIGKAATEPLLMRVEDTTQHQFAASVDKFDVHARSLGRISREASADLSVSIRTHPWLNSASQHEQNRRH